MNAINKRERISEPRLVNNGHDIAEGIAEADADGSATVHDLVLTQRMIDRLLFGRKINDPEYQVAAKLRDCFERSKLLMGNESTRDIGAPLGCGRGNPDYVRDETAWRIYTRAMQQVGHWRHILRWVVIDDKTPESYGARFHCHGHAMLSAALFRLGQHFGIDTCGGGK